MPSRKGPLLRLTPAPLPCAKAEGAQTSEAHATARLQQAEALLKKEAEAARARLQQAGDEAGEAARLQVGCREAANESGRNVTPRATLQAALDVAKREMQEQERISISDAADMARLLAEKVILTHTVTHTLTHMLTHTHTHTLMYTPHPSICTSCGCV